MLTNIAVVFYIFAKRSSISSLHHLRTFLAFKSCGYLPKYLNFCLSSTVLSVVCLSIVVLLDEAPKLILLDITLPVIFIQLLDSSWFLYLFSLSLTILFTESFNSSLIDGSLAMLFRWYKNVLSRAFLLFCECFSS
ncbi:uncharacterized protein EV154DRAFT_522941 [Mucor mucedo]|uniref:uncharacterized protein n=1 Tax=Mucor mucedo TaxID=29922 RepID=UPI00221E81CE|nr:uncharacterized protein EV154DRAFT_522941 [Mucor mucedo]KAI7882820.1 hypothetical protein EV154DRAFT_522941 [Mucor mucedo]